MLRSNGMVYRWEGDGSGRRVAVHLVEEILRKEVDNRKSNWAEFAEVYIVRFLSERHQIYVASLLDLSVVDASVSPYFGTCICSWQKRGTLIWILAMIKV